MQESVSQTPHPCRVQNLGAARAGAFSSSLHKRSLGEVFAMEKVLDTRARKKVGRSYIAMRAGRGAVYGGRSERLWVLGN
jgi:hypothetical protein